MSYHTCKQSFSAILLFAFFIVAGCKKDNSTTQVTGYDFSYAGSQYLGGSLHFTPTVPSESTLLWSFGDSVATTSTAPNHQYTHTGKFIVSLMINGDSANIINKTIYIGTDSLHQSLVSGTWMWHKQTAGYLPTVQRDTVYYYNDTPLAVHSLEPGIIVFMTDTLLYSSITDSTINFSSIHYAVPTIPGSADAWSTFQYNYNSNKIHYNYVYHVSAGAGNWTDSYVSF